MRSGLFTFFLFAFSQLFSYSVKNYDYLLGMSGFSDELLQVHFQLYAGYVKNANDLLTKIEAADPFSYECGALRRRFSWEFDGMRLHELYFENLGGKSELEKKDPLYLAIEKQFGSFEKWKQDFRATGLTRGIGWALLYYDPESGALYNVWINEHDTGHLVNGNPILIMDAFEHAYMIQYKLDKVKYLDAFFKNIDWNVVSKRYREALISKK